MPLVIQYVIETKKIATYLLRRGLMKQYKKTKEYLLQGRFSHVGFKLRAPKSARVFYFRINKQYRAHALLDGTSLRIFKIDNHQG